MKVFYVQKDQFETAKNVQAAVWRRIPSHTFPLVGTPVGLQPTAAIRASWADKTIGEVSEVDVSAVHDGEFLAFRLSWKSKSAEMDINDTDIFPDAAAVLFASSPEAPLFLMGEPGKSVNAWYWRADENDGTGRHVVSEGLGTTETLDTANVTAAGVWDTGRWSIVLARAMQMKGDKRVVSIPLDSPPGIAVAVWEGTSKERGGIKAITAAWLSLELDPVSAGKSL